MTYRRMSTKEAVAFWRERGERPVVVAQRKTKATAERDAAKFAGTHAPVVLVYDEDRWIVLVPPEKGSDG